MARPLTYAFLALWIAVSAPINAESKTVQFISDKVLKRVKISGFRRLGYHMNSVTGDREAFNQTNYGGLGGNRFTDLGVLRVEGRKVGGYLDFDFNIQDSRFQDPQGEKFTVAVDEGKWNGRLGDIRGQLQNTNRFARVNNTLRGVSLAYKSKGFDARIIASEARGQARTVTIQGTNSSGPYFLQSSQIIRGSERVEVDGVPQVFGQDYTIDYEIGSITFMNRVTLAGKIIPPTSSIVATYESFNFNGTAGRVEGVGLSYNFGKSGKFGFTGIRQMGNGTNQQSTRTEFFQGFGAPSTPYFLQFEPLLTQPIIIRVDGIIQTEGLDYRFDTGNSAIFFFNRFMPTSSDIQVVYTPKPTADVQGDREAIGFDYTLPLGNKGNLVLTHATGRLSNTLNPSSGSAKSADLRYASGPFTILAGVRDVPDGFVSIESTTFNRNEKGHNVDVEFKPKSGQVFGLQQSNYSIAQRTASGSNTSITRSRFSRAEASYSLLGEANNGWPISLTASRNQSRTGTNESDIDTISLGTNRVFGKLNTRLSAEKQSVTGTATANLFSWVFGADYSASNVWNFSTELGLSQIAANSEKGTGHDISFTSRYRPSDKFNVRFQLADSDAGRVSSISGFNNGFGSGFNGNGFTSGAVSPTTNAAAAGRLIRLSGDWQVDDRLALIGSASLFRSTGNITSNSETRALSGGIDYDLGGRTRLSGSLDLSETKFIGSGIRSSATTLNMFINGSPAGRFSYRSGVSALVSGGDSQFKQDAFTFESDLNYNLAPRHTLNFNFSSGQVTGHLPQDDLDMSLTYQYQIWESLALNVGYRFRDVRNRDINATSGAYRSQGLDIVLAFNFFR